MPEEVVAQLAEMGFKVGMKLIDKALEPERQINRGPLADALVQSSIYAAGKIVMQLQILDKLDGSLHDFVDMVAAILDELFFFTELLTDEKLTINNCTIKISREIIDHIKKLHELQRHPTGGQ